MAEADEAADEGAVGNPIIPTPDGQRRFGFDNDENEAPSFLEMLTDEDTQMLGTVIKTIVEEQVDIATQNIADTFTAVEEKFGKVEENLLNYAGFLDETAAWQRGIEPAVRELAKKVEGFEGLAAMEDLVRKFVVFSAAEMEVGRREIGQVRKQMAEGEE